MYAYTFLLSDPFPGFVTRGDYPVGLEVDPPERQSRWVTFFRGILAIPAFLIEYVLIYLLELIAFLAWFVCLFAATMPEGFENLGSLLPALLPADVRVSVPAHPALPEPELADDHLATESLRRG